jgi:type II secretory pathway pseudopilin PulG
MLVNDKLHHHPTRPRERGYLLLALLLAISLLVIATAAVAPSIALQIKRDREEEMIHRATQYSRAIKHYFKKFGRYPSRIEDLENTNNTRFLRKRYKDPITGKDFRLLRYGDVKLFSQNAPGQPVSALGATGLTATLPQNGPAPERSANLAAQPGSDSGQPASSTSLPPGVAAIPGQSGGTEAESGQNHSTFGIAGQTLGGGPIVGVASTSHAETVREFNKKHHYNDWQFIYDPSLDRGGLLVGPAQPPLAGAIPAQPAAGTTPGQMQPSQNLGNPNIGSGSANMPSDNMPPDINAQPQQ